MHNGAVDRIPPNSLEAEMALLGSILVDRDVMPAVRDIVRHEDFYATLHGTIFIALLNLADACEPMDKIALAEHLRALGMLDKVGGIAYLSGLMDTVATASSAEYYAHLVKEKSALRALIHAGTQITRLGYEGEFNVEETLVEAERIVVAVAKNGYVEPLPQTGAEIASELHWRMMSGQQEDPLRTPWPGLNEMLGGFMPGELVVIAAGAKQGKTGLVMCAADYMAYEDKGAVVLFPVEMGHEATERRYIAMYADVSDRAQRVNNLSEYQKRLITTAVDGLSHHRNLYVLPAEVNSVAKIRRSLVTIAKRGGPIRAFFVDLVGYLSDASDGSKNDTKNLRMERVWSKLRDLAREFNTVCFGVQHLNREGSRVRPTMLDIRDGGNPEGIASAIISPYREFPDGSIDERRKGELIVTASRFGDTGSVEMTFLGQRALWLTRGEDDAWWIRGWKQPAERAS
jgi:replicative DNA helicase